MRFIFALCLKGASLNRIQDELCQRKIPSPTGKDAWCKQSINMLLSSEKYNGDVMLMKSVSLGSIGSKRMRSDGQADKYLAVSNHPPIIDKETFEAAQKEKLKRSSIMGIDSVVKR